METAPAGMSGGLFAVARIVGHWMVCALFAVARIVGHWIVRALSAVANQM
ncbi:hypothetical protein ACFTAO_03285 [Paenibacillus rhizoplanae]